VIPVYGAINNPGDTRPGFLANTPYYDKLFPAPRNGCMASLGTTRLLVSLFGDPV